MEGLPLPHIQDHDDTEFADLSAENGKLPELKLDLEDGDGSEATTAVDEEEVERGMKEFEEKLKLSSFSRKRELEKQKRLGLMMAKYSSLSPSGAATPGSPTSSARSSLLSTSSSSPFMSTSSTPVSASSPFAVADGSPSAASPAVHAASPFIEEETGERRRELEELRIRLAAKDAEIKRLIREKQDERRSAEDKDKAKREFEEKWAEGVAEIELLKSSLESQQIILQHLQDKEEERKLREAEAEAENTYFHQELEQKMKEKTEDLEEELLFREEEVRKMEEQLAQLEEEREREKAAATKLKTKIAELAKEIEKRDKELAARKDAKDKESTEKDKKMQELESKVKKMQKEREMYKRMKEEAAQKDRELKQVREATQQIKEGLVQAKHELEQRADEERKRREELEELRRTLTESERENEALRGWKTQQEREAEAAEKERRENEERRQREWEAKLAVLAEEKSASVRDSEELRRQLEALKTQEKDKENEKQKEIEEERERRENEEREREKEKAKREQQMAEEERERGLRSASIASMIPTSVTKELVTAAREELDMVHFLTTEVEAMIQKNESENRGDESAWAVWNERKKEALAAISDLKEWSDKVAKYAEEATQNPKNITLQERLMGSQKQMGKRFEKMISLSLPLSPSPQRQEQLRTALETLTALRRDQDEEDGSESPLGGGSLTSSSSSVSLSSSHSYTAVSTETAPQRHEDLAVAVAVAVAVAEAEAQTPAAEARPDGVSTEKNQAESCSSEERQRRPAAAEPGVDVAALQQEKAKEKESEDEAKKKKIDLRPTEAALSTTPTPVVAQAAGVGVVHKSKSPNLLGLAQKTVNKVDQVLATLHGPQGAAADKAALAKEIMELIQSLIEGLKAEINSKSTDTKLRAQLSEAAGLLRDKSTQIKIISSVRSHRSGPDHGQVEQTAIELNKQVKELINVLIVASLKKRLAASLNQVAAVKRVFAVFKNNQGS